MIAALSLSFWRARGRRRFGAKHAALAVGFHVLAMASHQPAAAALVADVLHAHCHDEAPAAPAHDSGAPHRQHAPPCPICQSLQAFVPPPQAPAVALSLWSVAPPIAPPGVAIPPRLVLTDLNPRGPPVIG
jgi:hypothetical protein